MYIYIYIYIYIYGYLTYKHIDPHIRILYCRLIVLCRHIYIYIYIYIQVELRVSCRSVRVWRNNCWLMQMAYHIMTYDTILLIIML